MPLFLCCALLSGVGRTFIDEKPCPKLKSVIKGKSTVQENTLSCYELGRVQGVLREKIMFFFLPQDLLNDIFPTFALNW